MHTPKSAALRDPARAVERLERLWRLGDPPFANRPGLSDTEQVAAQQVGEWMTAAGLDVSHDPIGNVVGARTGLDPTLSEIWLGSHLDSVPAGGRFDGALGVVTAIEAVGALTCATDRTIRIFGFREEEGSRFGRSCLGSRALCGQLEPGELGTLDLDGISVESALSRLGYDASAIPTTGWLDRPPRCFIEPHIEQGPVLARAGSPIGVVTEIVGTSEWQLTFRGRRGHAGTTPMSDRADALVAASEFISQLPALTLELPGAVATVGSIHAIPGAQNVIPETVDLSLDLRAATPSTLDRLQKLATELAKRSAADHGCSTELLQRARTAPVQMSALVRGALEQIVADLGLPVVTLPSGAGHDAAVLAAAGVPTGMLFARSLNDGLSHSPDELTDADAIGAAIAALTAVVATLADR